MCPITGTNHLCKVVLVEIARSAKISCLVVTASLCCEAIKKTSQNSAQNHTNTPLHTPSALTLVV